MLCGREIQAIRDRSIAITAELTESETDRVVVLGRVRSYQTSLTRVVATGKMVPCKLICVGEGVVIAV